MEILAINSPCGCHSDQECGCGSGGSCDCGGHDGRFARRYQTRVEQVAELESYLRDLQSEVQAVEEHLADLRK